MKDEKTNGYYWTKLEGSMVVMRALYLGPDDRQVGLEHGKHYEITKKKTKSGKIVVTFEDLSGLKKRYKDNQAFKFDFLLKRR